MSDKRTFESGATRNSEEGKFDYEGFLSPVALEQFAKYMHKHRHLEDGGLRASDNWQKGISFDSYMKSLWRHVITHWRWHRGLKNEEDQTAALCGIIFNAMGYLHELHKVPGMPMTERYQHEMDLAEDWTKRQHGMVAGEGPEPMNSPKELYKLADNYVAADDPYTKDMPFSDDVGR